MSRIGRGDAERLLDGLPTEHPAVAALLHAAAAPAEPAELAGADAVVAMFRRTYRSPQHERSARTTSENAQPGQTQPAAQQWAGRPRGRPSRRRAVLVAAGFVLLLLAGGAGVAAGEGRLPEPLQRAAHDFIAQVPQSAPTHAAAATPSPHRPPTAAPSAGYTPGTSSPNPGPSGWHGGGPPWQSWPPGQPYQSAQPEQPSSAEVKRLCHEWEKARDDPHKPMSPADERTLTAAAGGEEHIAQFCGVSPATRPSSKQWPHR